jgi:RNA polymerase-binding transcription factor DksA
MALISQDIEKLKEKLLQTQKDIAKQLKDLGEVPEFGTDTEGETFEEESDEAEEYSKNLGIKQELKARLLDIKNALDKIHNNAYGKCEKCQMEIERKILDIDPESRLCKNCKK